ncbi:heme utilization cystosolic carrier protein HutX [Shewanella fidelis]|uniref:Heme utilization cystosolic carrier protein HutX n=1 Tax=Shewanella fidelis TaxID=173509 RepID=A0AAW8NIR3_9GAMM|nr:heme utilization cystosolic carrier protein HutX [Shewanella fidelis]MDR8522625.1 heme utilization cystosolic carrier protein HutX [Shewanella fidelis]MDW4812241.1 heme utilization cystosolic carrier protein HutX [Shewanella fidelis]MDW4816095.1 heme utilization cystosolic carrier protein HutX [Shewanella fidelis]MDW4820482.1 heme utilization cystosolic carrier protein HutX [Shewanella fidelis]MDW4824704.1 heme utilization cystosolic carrier protein HutX [Shewanella fidelis]
MSVSVEQIRQHLQANPAAMPSQIAEELNISEFEVVSALPAEQVAILPLEQKDALLEELPEWGNMTTIVSASGSIFEFKGSFPKGKYAHGYYNLITKGDGLHGHLKLDVISAIALISKPFRGTESHSINFFGPQGEVVFKVYLGRDKKRVLLPEQVARFTELKQSVNSEVA